MSLIPPNTLVPFTQQPDFAKSREQEFRRYQRQVVKRSNLTRGEKDVAMAFVNHWLVHRKDGAVHPGRAKLAKAARASLPTVKRTLALLRHFGVIEAVAFEAGNCADGFGKATEYTLDTNALFHLARVTKADLKRLRKVGFEGNAVNIGGSNEPLSGGIKMNPRNKYGTVTPFPKQGGGK